VPVESDSLPPALDVEVTENCPDARKRIDVQKEISVFVAIAEAHFHKPVLLYTTHEFMRMYRLKEFNTHHVWIRSLFSEPRLPATVSWLFWQFKNRGRIRGIRTLVDVNVFHGDEKEFAAWRNAHK